MGSTSVYLKAYANSSEADRELGAYFRFYNDQRPHQALGYQTPAEVFHAGPTPPEGRIKGEEVCSGSSLGIIGRSGSGGTLT